MGRPEKKDGTERGCEGTAAGQTFQKALSECWQWEMGPGGQDWERMGDLTRALAFAQEVTRLARKWTGDTERAARAALREGLA